MGGGVNLADPHADVGVEEESLTVPAPVSLDTRFERDHARPMRKPARRAAMIGWALIIVGLIALLALIALGPLSDIL
jgi:hypothetical protein